MRVKLLIELKVIQIDLCLYNSYKVDPDVTRSRIYLETMEKVLSNVNKVIMDKSASSSGIVPYLPIDKLQGKGTK
jgi:membrane protease subunit HflK